MDRSDVKTFVTGVCGAALVLGGLVAFLEGAGPVALAQYGGTPVAVNAAGCILLDGGRRTVPAGSAVVIRSGWLTGPKGGVESFLQAQTTLISVADGRMIDVSGEYVEPARSGANWVSILSRPTGVTLREPGDSMRFTFTLLLSRNVTDVFDVDGDGVPEPSTVREGLSFGGTCTVTAT